MIPTTGKFNKNNEGEVYNAKSLPDAFQDNDGMPYVLSIFLSAVLHPIMAILIWLLIAAIGFMLPSLDKPELHKKDLEFKLVTADEAPPINKKTNIRSDRNSRAGGIHDPKRPVSQPTAKAAPKKQAKSIAPSPAPVKKQVKKPAPAPKKKVINKPIQQQITESIKKPTPVKAPVAAQKPALKPNQRPVSQAPKISQTPKSPFSVAVPKTDGAPIGPSPKYGTSSGTGYKGGTSTSSGGSSTSGGAPAPVFSASKSGSSTGSGTTGSKGSSGSGYSGGNVGNPSPGNPSGAPGIDAIRQPNWGPYMRDLESRIKRNWNPPKGDASKRVVLLFKIGRDGRLLSINVVKTSGQPLSDQAAKSAVELTAPFRPLPPEFKGSSVDIEFTFDYNVFGSKYR